MWGKGGNGISRHRRGAFVIATLALALAAPGTASAKQNGNAYGQQDEAGVVEEVYYDLSGFDFLSNWVE